MSVNRKFQSNRLSRLAGYRQHIYIRMSCFFLYRFGDKNKLILGANHKYL